MRVVGIDTSGYIESITLIEDGRVLGDIREEVKTHSVVLLPNLIKFLQQYDLKLNDIDGWGIAIGPGSFTGLRIGLATLHGITFRKSTPIVGVITLRAMAFISGVKGLVAPAIDARKREIYTALYRYGEDDLQVIEEERAVAPIIWLDLIASYGEEITMFGSGVERYKEIFKDKVKIINVDVPISRGVALLAYKELLGGYRGKPVEPFYIRKSEAEINLEKKKLKID